MLQTGTKVRLLTKIGDYPTGTEAVVVSVTGYLFEIEFVTERRLIIDGNDVLQADRFADPE